MQSFPFLRLLPINQIIETMQERHTDRELYFKELSATSKKYFIPYIRTYHKLEPGMNVLEIGCGEGGNLLPFSILGCNVMGVDMAENRIKDARVFFAKAKAEGKFISSDIFKLEELKDKFDIIICHDVFEHIAEKKRFLDALAGYLKPTGIAFVSFPAWQMPFGGHQQICRSRFLSRIPFIHLLPAAVYRSLLEIFGETDECIEELLSIKRTRTSVELFEKMVRQVELDIVDRILWLINPHYEIKFGLHPCRVGKMIACLPYLRDFVCSSCFYILKRCK